MANPSIKINDTLVFEQASGVSKLSNNVTIDSGVTFPAGHVLQVKIASKDISSGISHGSSSYVDIHSVSITPVTTNSKFLLIGGFSVYRNSTVPTNSGMAFVRNVNGGSFTDLMKDNYSIYDQDTFNGARHYGVSRSLLDDPTYTAGQVLIYKSQQNTSDNSSTQTLGRATELVVMEISAS